MKRRAVASFAALLFCTACGIPDRNPSREADGPVPGRLVVLLVVDQLPQYLLERYDTLFSGGFRRLLDDGRVYARALHEHARTTTAPGHASIATGMFPFRHGVPDNGWREPDGDRWVPVDNYADRDELVVGLSTGDGFSPRKLRASALADWLRDADPEARVFAASGKVRGAVPLAGHVRGHVYVLSYEHGPAFVTSTYYRRRLPSWVSRFNEGRLAELLADSVWESGVPARVAAASRPDSTSYERGGRHFTFPHAFAEEKAAWEDRAHGFLHWFWRTPMLDVATLDLAAEAVRELELGQRGRLDLLALGLSATDPIGHAYGPHSREQLANLLELDRGLGELFAFLDATVGRDGYVVALSADHGVMEAPEHRVELGQVGVRISPEEVRAALRAAEALQAPPGPEFEARRAALLEGYGFVSDAMTREELLAVDPEGAPGAGADSFTVLYRRSLLPDRVISPGQLGILVRLREGYMVDEATATHGSPYLYDRHVPLILMGPGVEPGWTEERVATVDLVPTLAELLGIPFPADLDGRPLVGAPGPRARDD